MTLSQSDACVVLCRGVATFPEGVPEPPGTLRMIWSARGVRVGISSISRTQCFWFTTLTCPEVRPLCPCSHLDLELMGFGGSTCLHRAHYFAPAEAANLPCVSFGSS